MFQYPMYPYIDREVTGEILPTKGTINDRWKLVQEKKYIAFVKVILV